MNDEHRKVIIIDDDDRNIFALKAVLKAKGFIVIAATSAKEGLEILQTQKDIGIALIDMMMPDMDGYQMIAEIKKQPPLKNMPLIAVTAQAMVGDREKCLEMGADNYIAKPINVDVLLTILNQYLK
ncbi:MAG: response regulator [Sphingobacteriales bacterium]|nr:response regulator [Sphingobacteriales bacterium]